MESVIYAVACSWLHATTPVSSDIDAVVADHQLVKDLSAKLTKRGVGFEALHYVWLVDSEKSAAELYLELLPLVYERGKPNLFVAEITPNAIGSYIANVDAKALKIAGLIGKAGA
jgi:hypothetical protein